MFEQYIEINYTEQNANPSHTIKCETAHPTDSRPRSKKLSQTQHKYLPNPIFPCVTGMQSKEKTKNNAQYKGKMQDLFPLVRHFSLP